MRRHHNGQKQCFWWQIYGDVSWQMCTLATRRFAQRHADTRRTARGSIKQRTRQPQRVGPTSGCFIGRRAGRFGASVGDRESSRRYVVAEQCVLKPKAKPTRPAEGKVESRAPKRARRTSSSPRSPPCPQSRPQAQSQLSEPQSREQSRESCMKTLSQARSQLGVRLNHMRTHNQGMKILVHVKAVVAQDKLGGICIAAAISSLQHTSVAVVTPKCRFTFLALQPHMRPQCLCPSVARRQRGLWK